MKETIYDRAKRELKEGRYLVTVDRNHPYWRFLLGEWKGKGEWNLKVFDQERMVVTWIEKFRVLDRSAAVVYFSGIGVSFDELEPSFFLIGSELDGDLDRAAEWGAFL